VIKQNPEKKSNQIAVVLGEMWRRLSKEEKDAYK